MNTAVELAPHERKELKHMSFQEIETMLEGIRERRLSAANAFIQAQELAFTVKVERLKAKLEKEMGMFTKEEVALDKAIAKVEARAVKLHAIKQEIDFMTSNNLMPLEEEQATEGEPEDVGQSETKEE